MTDYLGRLFSYTGMRVEPGSSARATETGGKAAPIHSEETRSIRPQTDTSEGMSSGKKVERSSSSSESNVQRASLQNSESISPSGSSVEAVETGGTAAPIHSEKTRSIRPQTDTSEGISSGKNSGKSHPSSESNVQRASLQNSELIRPLGSNEQPPRSSPDKSSLGKTESKSTMPAKHRLEKGEKISDARPDAERDTSELSPGLRLSSAAIIRAEETDLPAEQRRSDGRSQKRVPPADNKTEQIFFKDVRNWVAEGLKSDFESGRKNVDEGIESAGSISGDEASNESMYGLSEAPGQSSLKFLLPERGKVSTADTGINDLHVSIGTISLTVENSEAPGRPPAPLPSGKGKKQSTVKARSRLGRHYIRLG